jgi:5-methyltetrahydropteroyltriglutamate--homocysteine methyltransferase
VTVKPFYRADQVGSLLRPADLIAARQAHADGRLDATELRQVEDAAIAASVRQQEALGLPVVVDGEFRRENWWIDFIARLNGIEITDGAAAQTFVRTATADCCDHGHGRDHDRDDLPDTTAVEGQAPQEADEAGWRYVPKSVYTRARLSLGQPVNTRDFAYLRSVAQGPAKITLPSPSRLHFHGGRAAVSRETYPDIEAFYADVVTVYRSEIAALEEAGCRYIQIDDPLMTYFISERLRQEVREEGEEPDARLARYVQLTNDCIAARRPDTTVGVHLCRGNSRSGWISEGGYARIAEAVFGGLRADHLLLEYDDERSGDFEPLRHMPSDRRVVLGLVTTKRGTLESRDALLRRIDEAARLVPLEHLAISPQCGFASTVEGNIITPDDQWAKLALCVDVAREVWGKLSR